MNNRKTCVSFGEPFQLFTNPFVFTFTFGNPKRELKALRNKFVVTFLP